MLVAAAALLAAPLIANAAVDFLLLPRVEQAFARGDNASAFALLEGAIKDPDTPPDAQVDLLATLASARLARGDFADAGEAYALEAELTGRLKGASAPELAGLYAAGADAYLHAGRPESALPLAEEAIRVDGIYTDCASPILARDHARLADILAALGRAADAADQRRLADDLDIRCGRAGPSSRGVVVTNDFADATPDSFARVKVFYATDRAPSGSDRPNDFYGPERGKSDYGVLEVTVPRIHKPGSVEAPSLIKLEWSENPERHFVITKLATMSEAEMFADMGSTLADRRADEVFVFVHGFNVTFADAAKRTAQIAYDLNFEGAPILYSWASRGSTLAYTSDEAVVRLSGRHLLRFLEDLVAQPGAKHINLIAHSMGNRALADALELLAAKRSGAGVSAPLFDQVIFAAPDEDAGLFAEMIKTIRPLARRLTLYGSENDLALYASRAGSWRSAPSRRGRRRDPAHRSARLRSTCRCSVTICSDTAISPPRPRRSPTFCGSSGATRRPRGAAAWMPRSSRPAASGSSTRCVATDRSCFRH